MHNNVNMKNSILYYSPTSRGRAKRSNEMINTVVRTVLVCSKAQKHKHTLTHTQNQLQICNDLCYPMCCM